MAATETISMATSVETSMATRGEITREIVVDTTRTIGEITGAGTTRENRDRHCEWSEHFVGMEQWTDCVTLARDTILEAVATTLIVVTEISSITDQDIAVVIMGILGRWCWTGEATNFLTEIYKDNNFLTEIYKDNNFLTEIYIQDNHWFYSGDQEHFRMMMYPC